jgi:hypothetical protein
MKDESYTDSDLATGRTTEDAGSNTYPTPFRDSRIEKWLGRDNARAIVEIRMVALSNAIREKEDWQSKRLNPEIVEKWTAELLAQEESIKPQHRLSLPMVRAYDSNLWKEY